MTLKLITPPVSPITLPEAKSHLRVDHSDDDAYISTLIDTATRHIDGPDGRMRRAVLPQTWELAIDAFPAAEIWLPVGPLMSITSLSYIDADGMDQVIGAENYVADTHSDPGWLIPISGFSWPSHMAVANAVRVRWVAGMGETCPPDIKHAMLLVLGHLYEHRAVTAEGSHAELPMAVDALIHIKKRLVVA